MHIWPSYARRLIRVCGKVGSEIRGCGGPIEAGEQIFRGRTYFRDKKHTDCYFHRRCWIENCDRYWNEVPYKPKDRGTPGRPVLDLALEQRRRRYSLLTRASQIRKERLEMAAAHLPWEAFQLRAKDINTRMRRVALGLRDCGGVPTTQRWNEYRNLPLGEE